MERYHLGDDHWDWQLTDFEVRVFEKDLSRRHGEHKETRRRRIKITSFFSVSSVSPRASTVTQAKAFAL